MSVLFMEGRHHRRPSRFKKVMFQIAYRIDNFLGVMPV